MSQPPVSIHPYFKVHPGQMSAAQAIVPQFMEKSSAEKGLLYYEFTVNGDVVFCREAYRDAEAALLHLDNVSTPLGAMLQVSDLIRLEIHGPASELEKMKTPLAALPVEWFEYADGLKK